MGNFFKDIGSIFKAGQTKSTAGEVIKNRPVYDSLLSDPSMKFRTNDVASGGEGGGITVNENPDRAAIVEADRQRLELQKKVGTKGSSILGGGLY